MSWTYTPEFYKQYTRDTWNESAPVYDLLRRNLDLYNPEIFAMLDPRSGERLLDVATGPGEPALALAPKVAPGAVTGIDLSERMVEIARERAKAAGVPNVAFEVMDAEALTFPEAAFDGVVCRFGLQIVTDPDRTMAEILRVLRPGGRFVASVWGPGERVPAIHAIVEPMLAFAEPDETGYLPTPYEMGGEGELVALLGEAGFVEARERRVTRAWRFRDEAEYFRATLEGSPIGHSLREEDEDVQRQVLARARDNVRRWASPEGLRMPAEAVVVAASKPA